MMKYNLRRDGQIEMVLDNKDEVPTYFWRDRDDIIPSHSGRLYGTFERYPPDQVAADLMLFIARLMPRDVRTVSILRTDPMPVNMCFINATIKADNDPNMDIVKGFYVVQLEKDRPHYVATKHWWNRDKRDDSWHDFTGEIDPNDDRRLLVESPLGQKRALPASKKLERQERRLGQERIRAILQLSASLT